MYYELKIKQKKIYRHAQGFALIPLRGHLHKKERLAMHANRAQLTERSQGKQQHGLTSHIRLIAAPISTKGHLPKLQTGQTLRKSDVTVTDSSDTVHSISLCD